MTLYQKLSYHLLQRQTSWKNAAFFNSIVLICLVLPLLILTILSITESHSLGMLFIFYSGACDQVSKINKGLHLALNVASSLILASSNFFMQILNAPTRSEIDEAHTKGTWLEIGVPSTRNAFRVSRFKTFFWVVLLLSSIPIHLVFNSAIFQTNQIMGDYTLTVASEAFVNGEPYFFPGTGLSNITVNTTQKPDLDRLAAHFIHSHARLNISYAQHHAKKEWDWLSAAECVNQYADGNCSGLQIHRNVVVILSEPLGWTRNEAWRLSQNETAFWDMVVPGDRRNPLWSFANCSMSTRGYAGYACETTCWGVSSGGPINPRTWIIDNFQYSILYHHSGSSFFNNPQPQIDDSRLQVSHCYAEPQHQICRIGLSTTLLFVVLLCVVVKATAAMAVTWKLSRQPEKSLVTIGDAISSFLCRADTNTSGMCTIDQKHALTIMRPPSHDFLPTPREWCEPPKRLRAFIPKSVWVTSYALIGFGLLFALGLVVCGAMFGV